MRLHLDIDAYYVSAERSRSAALKNKPVIVVSTHTAEFFDEAPSNYSIVLAKSYEAKAMGVKTAMLSKDALKLCPNACVLPCDHSFYKQLSRKLRKYLHTVFAQIERFSIDEFFVELDGQVKDQDAYAFALKLQNDVLKLFDLPISIGISSSKWGAKFLTTMAKPFGVLCMDKDELLKNYADVEIAQFAGIGKASLKELNRLGVFKLKDVALNKQAFLSLGKNGLKNYKRIMGVDDEAVVEEERKSFGIGRSFLPIISQDELKRRLLVLNTHLCFEFLAFGLHPKSFSLSVVYKDNTKVQKSCQNFESFNEELSYKTFLHLFKLCPSSQAVRGLHLSLGSLSKQKPLGLFDKENKTALFDALFKLRSKYGVEIIKKAKEAKLDD